MHESVLIREAVELLNVKAGGRYVDGTLGGGGHSRAILEKAGPDGFLLGIDRDESALERAGAKLGELKRQARLVHGNFGDLRNLAEANGAGVVDGILLDIGISSDQLDEGERGFSFMKDGPLDMRMDVSGGCTAADLVNGLPEEELCSIIRDYGEERLARQVARAIVRERAVEPITRTGRLAAIVEKSVGGRRGRVHPATRTFQGLRIRVNGELDELERGLEGGLALLAPGGRMAVISFHSLEDRIVKRFFVRHAGRWESLQAGGRKWIGETPVVSLVTRKPVVATDEETAANPRARSAKLRVAEKVPDDGTRSSDELQGV